MRLFDVVVVVFGCGVVVGLFFQTRHIMLLEKIIELLEMRVDRLEEKRNELWDGK